MSGFGMRTRRWFAVLAAVVLVVAGGIAMLVSTGSSGPEVKVRDVGIDVTGGPDGEQLTRIDGTLHLPERTPAPAVLVAHGFGGSKDTVADQARELAERGFVVLAYSARGFGRSTGQIMLNSPDHEVADAAALVDWLAEQPEVVTDGTGDPRVGVTGASYGGALALLLAGTDRRVDAVVPLITWNDLAAALLPNAAGTGTADARTAAEGTFEPDGVFKRSWASIFFSAGLAPGSASEPRGEAPEPGDEPENGQNELDSGAPEQAAEPPAGTGRSNGSSSQPTLPPGMTPDRLDVSRLGCGRFHPDVCQAYIELATTGRASPDAVELLRRGSPATVADRITAPTMLVQGQLDTLFGLEQADATARQIASAGGKVKVVWYPGGHDGGSPGRSLRARIADWFDFHLSGNGDDPGTEFEYAVQGSFQRIGAPSVRTVSAPGYPGLEPGTAADRERLELSGDPQPVFLPPGGSPASTSSVPGLSRLLGTAASVGGGLAADIPGQTATFNTAPVSERLLVAGSPQVRLRVSALPGATAETAADAGAETGAVLFAKLYDVAPDGRRTLPGGGVAAIRLTGLPADGSPAEVTVTLPGIVRPIEPDHWLLLVVSSTDQAYALPAEPAVHLVGLAGGAELAVPVVPGRSTDGTAVPTVPLVGLVVVLGLVVLAAVVAAVRRGRTDGADPELAGVPLVIRGLTKRYPGGLTAVDDLSFRVEPGQVLGLLGPNGAGKTTTLRMLMGLIRPNAGELLVFGHRVRPGAPVLSRIGSFIEGPGLVPHLSGMEHLRLYWAATGRPAADARMDEALEVAALGDAVQRRVSTYSHGMKQRLAIAQAMLGMPQLLVLDEPTNGLDPPQIREMRDVLRRYAGTGRTVLVSSHLLAEVEQTCTHVVVMHRGRLVASGAVGDIVAGGGQATFRVDDPDRAVKVLRGMAGVGEVVVDDVDGAAGPAGAAVYADLGRLSRSFAVTALVEAGVAVESAGPRRRLEDAFLALVGEHPDVGSSGEVSR